MTPYKLPGIPLKTDSKKQLAPPGRREEVKEFNGHATMTYILPIE